LRIEAAYLQIMGGGQAVAHEMSVRNATQSIA
jgi:hypothetical protein